MCTVDWCKMRIFKFVLGAGLALFALAGAIPKANACVLYLCGTFNVAVYQGTNTGSSSDPMEFANSSNPLLAGAALATGTLTGTINFSSPPSADTISAFLSNSGANTLSASLTGLTEGLSTGNYGLTTLFVISGVLALAPFLEISFMTTA